MLHNTVAVHEFLKHVIKHIFSLALNLTKITHFTDGARAQYKNYKNVSNLLFHTKNPMLKRNGTFLPLAMGKDPVRGLEVLLRGWLEGQVFKGGNNSDTAGFIGMV